MHGTAGEPVGVYQAFVRNLVFYARSRQVVLFDEGHARDFLNTAGRVLLVVREVDLPRLERLSGRTLTRLAEVRYLNTAEVRVRTVVWPRPEEDIEAVVLVANR
jgi:hypothetical protein